MHVALVPLTGFRVREAEMLRLGMRLPGLTQRAAAIAELPALGLLTLAGGLPAHWSASYHPVSSVDEKTVEMIAASDPQFVAVSALTASIEDAYRLGRQLREWGIATVLGGLHATACPVEALKYFNAVVVGSAEGVWPQILDDAASRRLAGKYVAPPIADFEWLMPRFDLLGSEPARFTLQTQRGCPLACEFCGASRLLGRFREKPIEMIRRELAAICEIEPRPLLELADDNTFAGNRDAGPLLDALSESEARWFTECDWRIGERPELLKRLAAAGCRQILMGIESLVFRYPGQGKKRAELARVLKAVDAIQDAGVVVNGCFIVGAEGETRESLDRLGDFLIDSSFAEIQVTLQTPFPGTELYRRLQREGRLLTDRGWSHYTLFDVTYQPDRLSVPELEQGFRELLTRVFADDVSRKRDVLRRQIWRRGRNRNR